MRAALRPAALLLVLAAAVAFGWWLRGQFTSPVAPLPETPGARAARLSPSLIAAHYFGRQWPKNVINGFRREHVAADFAALRADGFNAVVLLVPWGDFQPVIVPCCQNDERAWARLHFLIDSARAAGLEVVLRVGYGWHFHPEADEVLGRIHRLLGDAGTRDVFLGFVERLAAETAHYPHLRLSFMSWEDQWLHRIDEEARPLFDAFLASLPADDPLRAHLPADGSLPRKDDASAPLFHRYWDWLKMEWLFRPSLARLSPLSYEVRIDREPLPEPRPDGSVHFRWIGHESTYRLPGADLLTLYWAPFWGARNEGERLSADEALRLLRVLLGEAREFSGGLPLFVDQLNVIDNTVGYGHHAALADDALDDFMAGAGCALREAGAIGYGYWTVHDYAESPLYNPAFAYGLDGWALTTGDAAAPGTRLRLRDSGDHDLALRAGDALAQVIPSTRGRLPTAGDALADRICVVARVDAPATLEIAAGGEPVTLTFDGGEGESRRCTPLAPQPADDTLRLELRVLVGAPAITSVQLFDHIQEGGVYRHDGAPGPLRDALRRLNREFAAPARGCTVER